MIIGWCLIGTYSNGMKPEHKYHTYMCTSTFWNNEILPKDEAKIEVILQKWSEFWGFQLPKVKKGKNKIKLSDL